MDLKLLSKYRTQLMGIAILAIMFFHSHTYRAFPFAIDIIKRYGNGGVEIFFLLSGFGLFFAYKKNNLKQFYYRRFIRILPYYIPIAVIFGLYMFSQNEITLADFFLKITMLSYFVEMDLLNWYIPVTLVFYLLAPLFFRFNKKVALFVAILLAIIVAYSVYETKYLDIVLMSNRLPIFILGFILGEMCANNKKIHIGYLIASALIGVAMLSFHYQYKQGEYIESISLYLSSSLFFFLAPPICCGLARLFSMFKNYKFPILTFFGSYSLSIYIFHERIMIIFEQLTGSLYVVYSFFLALLFAYLWQNFISKLVSKVSK